MFCCIFSSCMYLFVVFVCFFFFFKQKTAYEMRISDWSSDVCSSDLSSQGPALFSRHAAGSAFLHGNDAGRAVATDKPYALAGRNSNVGRLGDRKSVV